MESKRSYSSFMRSLFVDKSEISRLYEHSKSLMIMSKHSYYDENLSFFKLDDFEKKLNFNTILFPVFETNASVEPGVIKKCITELFLFPIMCKSIKHTSNYFYKKTIYTKLKCLFLQPIMEAEYMRMVHDNINYLNEKPFIITVETAISRIANDQLMKKIVKDIRAEIFKDLDNCTIKIVTDKPNKLLGSYKIKKQKFALSSKHKHNSTNDCRTNDYLIYDNSEENDHILIDLGCMSDTITNFVNYFIKISFLDLLKKEIIEDVSKTYNDYPVDKMKHEISISYIRNAKVFNDYLNEFVHNYVNIYEDRYEKPYFVIKDLILKIHLNGKEPIYDMISRHASEIPNETIISNLLLNRYSMIGKIEAFNKDYRSNNTSSISTCIDCETLRHYFTIMIQSIKDINKDVYKIYTMLMGTNYFAYKKGNTDDGLEFAAYIARQMINYIENNSTLEIENIINVLNTKRIVKIINDSTLIVLDIKKLKKSAIDGEHWESFLKELIEIFKDIYSKYQVLRTASTYFNDLVKTWVKIMEENIKFFTNYNPAVELYNYLNSYNSISSKYFHQFCLD